MILFKQNLIQLFKPQNTIENTSVFTMRENNVLKKVPLTFRKKTIKVEDASTRNRRRLIVDKNTQITHTQIILYIL